MSEARLPLHESTHPPEPGMAAAADIIAGPRTMCAGPLAGIKDLAEHTAVSSINCENPGCMAESLHLLEDFLDFICANVAQPGDLLGSLALRRQMENIFS